MPHAYTTTLHSNKKGTQTFRGELRLRRANFSTQENAAKPVLFRTPSYAAITVLRAFQGSLT